LLESVERSKSMRRQRREPAAESESRRQARAGFLAGAPSARVLSLLLAVAALCACAHVSGAKKVSLRVLLRASLVPIDSP
jgi:hypothetical protein